MLHYRVHAHHLRDSAQQPHPCKFIFHLGVLTFSSISLKSDPPGRAYQRSANELLQAWEQEGPLYGVQVHGVQFKSKFQDNQNE